MDILESKVFCLSGMKAHVFSEHSHKPHSMCSVIILTEWMCHALLIHSYICIRKFFPPLWPKLFFQNSFDRAMLPGIFGSVCLGAETNPIPFSCSPGRQSELGPLFERGTLDAQLHPACVREADAQIVLDGLDNPQDTMV